MVLLCLTLFVPSLFGDFVLCPLDFHSPEETNTVLIYYIALQLLTMNNITCVFYSQYYSLDLELVLGDVKGQKYLAILMYA